VRSGKGKQDSPVKKGGRFSVLKEALGLIESGFRSYGLKQNSGAPNRLMQRTCHADLACAPRSRGLPCGPERCRSLWSVGDLRATGRAPGREKHWLFLVKNK
jgi:hypothetical protein